MAGEGRVVSSTGSMAVSIRPSEGLINLLKEMIAGKNDLKYEHGNESGREYLTIPNVIHISRTGDNNYLCIVSPADMLTVKEIIEVFDYRDKYIQLVKLEKINNEREELMVRLNHLAEGYMEVN